MPIFIQGIELSTRFYRDVIAPIFESSLPKLAYSAALLGPGSEVLGFDSKRSTDHDWGPRLQLFLHAADYATHGRTVAGVLDEELPASFLGHRVRFAPDGTHRVTVTDIDTWCTSHLGFVPRRDIELLDWLATPTQRLAEFTAGALYHDGLGELAAMRERLRWYPHELWLYVLACQWRRVGQEEPFVGRCLELEDQRGARVISARLARDLMRLQLLIKRRYPPYSKWLGTAFAASSGAAELGPDMITDERKLRHACVATAVAFNGLGVVPTVDPAPQRFYDRPYWVLGTARFEAALRAHIKDSRIAALPPLGAIDQFVDQTDILSDAQRCRAITAAALGLT
jgi:hypothetical protein